MKRILPLAVLVACATVNHNPTPASVVVPLCNSYSQSVEFNSSQKYKSGTITDSVFFVARSEGAPYYEDLVNMYTSLQDPAGKNLDAQLFSTEFFVYTQFEDARMANVPDDFLVSSDVHKERVFVEFRKNAEGCWAFGNIYNSAEQPIVPKYNYGRFEDPSLHLLLPQ